LARWPVGVKSFAFRGTYSMRLISFSALISLVLLSSVAVAQQSPETTPHRPVGETIGHPPPLVGPPPIPEPLSTAAPAPAGSTPLEKEPAPKGYIGAYAPAGTPPPTPYSAGALPNVDPGPGLDRAAPDGSTKTVRAVPCSTAAHETDGFTTCVGIPDQNQKKRHPH
jgi:hypothetical protein